MFSLLDKRRGGADAIDKQDEPEAPGRASCPPWVLPGLNVVFRVWHQPHHVACGVTERCSIQW